MRKILLFALCMPTILFAQTTDMVSLGAGYANESYYSFENGEEANVINAGWDLAFELHSMGVGIRLNEKLASAWVYPGAFADWATLDTAGHTGWTRLRNSYEDWSEGAFNDISTGATYGWGEYNMTTHNVTGSKIFVIKLSDNSYRKIKFDLTSTSTIYNVTHNKIDNSDEVTTVIPKATYTGKNFVYYDIATETIIDREPASSDWDVVFTNYIYNLGGGYYGATTGGLHNIDVSTSEIAGVPTSSSTYGTFEDAINTIGYDWKTYAGGAYSIVADLSYFVKTTDGDIWKLIFTQFEGSSNGNIHFTKEKVETAGIATYEGANISVYPNPANDVLTISTTQDLQNLSIVDLSGQIVKEVNTIGFSSAQVSTSDLKNGVYFVQILDASNRTGIQKIVIQH